MYGTRNNRRFKQKRNSSSHIGRAANWSSENIILAHDVEIITKSKSLDEALFYVGKTIEQGLSRR